VKISYRCELDPDVPEVQKNLRSEEIPGQARNDMQCELDPDVPQVRKDLKRKKFLYVGKNDKVACRKKEKDFFRCF